MVDPIQTTQVPMTQNIAQPPGNAEAPKSEASALMHSLTMLANSQLALMKTVEQIATQMAILATKLDQTSTTLNLLTTRINSLDTAIHSRPQPEKFTDIVNEVYQRQGGYCGNETYAQIAYKLAGQGLLRT